MLEQDLRNRSDLGLWKAVGTLVLDPRIHSNRNRSENHSGGLCSSRFSRVGGASEPLSISTSGTEASGREAVLRNLNPSLSFPGPCSCRRLAGSLNETRVTIGELSWACRWGNRPDGDAGTAALPRHKEATS